MVTFIETGDYFMHEIQKAFTTLCKDTDITNTSEQTQELITNLKQIISDNLSILSDLKSQRKDLIGNHIKLQCDKEQLELELETLEEQLNLHVKHSGTDQEMLLKMMNQIEELKEENYDLSEQLNIATENNQRRLSLLSENKSNLNKKDIQHFMKTIEKYRCKLLALEAVIEYLRRNGVEIPTFPSIERVHKEVQVNNESEIVMSVQAGSYADEEKYQEKISELLKEKEYLETQNDAMSGKLRDRNDVTQELWRQLQHQKNEYGELKNKNSKLKEVVMEQEEFISDSGRSRVLKLGFLIAFVVGIINRKPKTLLGKIYL